MSSRSPEEAVLRKAHQVGDLETSKTLQIYHCTFLNNMFHGIGDDIAFKAPGFCLLSRDADESPVGV
jgi:hypothetical protein